MPPVFEVNASVTVSTNCCVGGRGLGKYKNWGRGGGGIAMSMVWGEARACRVQGC